MNIAKTLKPVLIAVIVLLFTLSITFAQDDFETKVFDKKTEIFPNETAEFSINITNNFASKQRFRFYFPNHMLFTVLTDPIRSSGVVILPNETVTTHVYLTAKNAIPERYVFPVKIGVDEKEAEKRVTTEILIKNPKPVEPPTFDPNVELSEGWPKITNKGELDPRDDFQVEVRFKNKNPLNIEGMNVHLKSNITDQVDERKKLDLGPLDTGRVRFKADYEDKTMPQKDLLLVTWDFNGTFFGPVEIPVEVMGYKKPFEVEKSSSKTFLKRFNNVTIYNPGTLPKTQEIKVPISWLESKFIKATPGEGKIYEQEGQKYISWDVYLEPFSDTKLTTRANFTGLFVTIIVIVLVIGSAVGLYYGFKHSVSARKKMIVEQESNGGITKMKVMLNVTNHSNKTVKEVKVMDVMPNIATVEKGTDHGVVQPDKILKHRKKGTLIKWDIGELEPKDERILTYKVNSNLPIVGDISLPTTSIKYSEDGARRVAKSNKCYLSQER